MFSDTITFFSHLKLSGHDLWEPYVLENVQWTDEETTERTSGAVSNEGGEATITIPGHEYLFMQPEGYDYIALGEVENLTEENFSEFMRTHKVGKVVSVKDRHHGRKLGHWKIKIRY